MKRAVITGLGIVSCIGNDKEAVKESLLTGKSGIKFNESYKEKGLKSNVSGSVDINIEELIDRKVRRFMSDASAYAYIAMKQAIEDAGLADEDVSNPKTGLIIGTGGASPENIVSYTNTVEKRGARKVSAFMVPRVMCSSTSAALATPFKIKGVNISISSACATSAHCIGSAYEQIQMGKQDIVFAGGGEEENWILSVIFDAMGALTSKYNDTPETASRAYDKNRDGFAIAGGGGVVVVEELEHALARGAKIYAEIVGFGSTSDGFDMVAPSGEGATRCMQQAIENIDGPVDYINTHGTSTPAGDIPEIKAIKAVFGDNIPKISSTKPLSGHSLGAASVHEAIYSLIMMENNFITASANIEELDPEVEGMPIVREIEKDVELNTVISNSFGFGGTNATLAFQKYKG